MSARRLIDRQSLFALALMPVMLAASGAAAQDLPSGGSVASGAAGIDTSVPHQLTVNQTTDKAIINWTDFSIGNGGTVQFYNGVGATLNRVTGTSVSQIDGLLEATGSVYLINPNGLIIGSSGVVDVGGSFVGSTLDLTDAAFNAGGDLTFTGGSTVSAVQNLGQVSALGGDVVLMATGTVTNGNDLNATGGTAALLSGTRILMRDRRLNDGKFVVELGGDEVANAGQIDAAHAELRSQNGNVYALAGNAGFINARGVQTVDGRVFLTSGSGNVRLEGEVSVAGGDGSELVMASGTGTVTAAADAVVVARQWTLQADQLTLDQGTADAVSAALSGSSGVDTNVTAFASAGDLTLAGTLSNTAGDVLTLSATGNVVVPYQIETTLGATSNVRADADADGAGQISVEQRLFSGTGDVNLYSNLDYSTFADAASYYDAASTSPATLNLYALINSYEQLETIHNFDNMNFALGRDIDASASSGRAFLSGSLTGNFDGLGHTISNLTINRTGASAALFETFTGLARDLTLTGSVSGDMDAASFAYFAQNAVLDNLRSSVNVQAGGNAGGLVTILDGSTTRNSTVTGSVASRLNGGSSAGGISAGAYSSVIENSVVSGTVQGNSGIGGLVGDAGNSTIRDSRSTGAVTGGDYVGGLVGRSSGVIENSFATGNVSGSSLVGGLAGYAGGPITNTYATGSVSGAQSVGGLVGQSQAAISGSSATGVVSGNEFVGGLVGQAYGAASISNSYAEGAVNQITDGTSFGGLVGRWATAESGSVSNSYATGAVTAAGSSYVGGLIGLVEGGTFSNVYATGAAAGRGYVGGLLGLLNSFGNSVTVQNGYSSGAVVSGTGNAGGLFGYVAGFGTTLVSLYYDIETSGQPDAIGYADSYAGTYPEGLTTAQAFQSGSYAFSDPTQWVQLDGYTRPMLASEVNAAVDGVTTINSIHQLQLMDLNRFGQYVLGRDISAAQTQGTLAERASSVFGVGGFVPIAASGQEFQGSLNGQGHRITGLTIDRDLNAVGLFGNVAYAYLTDLSLIGGSIANGAGTNNGVVGSLIGEVSNQSTVEDVYSSAAVTSRGGSAGTGGLIGTGLNGGATNVYRSAYDGTVTAVGAGFVGGIIGSVSGGYIVNTRVGGSVISLNGTSILGGVAGYAENLGFYTNLVTGNVEFTGGTVGTSGAIIGQSSGPYVSVTGTRWNTDTLGNLDAVGTFAGNAPSINDAFGRTAAELQDSTTLAAVYGSNFNFDTIWAPGTGASASSDNTAHFAELYRADNVLFIDGRGLTSVYGTPPTGADLTYRGGTRNGDLVTRDSTPIGVTATTGVGTYAATVSGGSALRQGGESAEYAYRVIRLADVTVTPRTLTAMLSGTLTKTYDGSATLALDNNVSLSNVVNGDDVTGESASNTGAFNSARVLDANAVTVSDLTLSGTKASNYVLASTTARGAGTITPLTLTAALSGSTTKIYDGTRDAALTDANYSVSAGVSGDEVGLNNPTNGTYDNKNAGPLHQVTADGLALTGADASNYVLASTSVTGKIGTITARDLLASLGGSATRVYDTTVDAPDTGLTYGPGTGYIAGDDLTFGRDGTGTATYDDRNAGIGKTVTVTDVFVTGGADQYNYNLTSNTASAAVGTITAATVTASLGGAVVRTYDGTTAAPVSDANLSLGGVYGGDTVGVAATVASYDDKNVGTGKTVTATLGLTGADAGNYVLASTSASAAIGQIDRAILTASLSGPITKVYDTTTAATVTDADLGLTGVVAGEDVTVRATEATYADANAGLNKSVTADGLALSGSDAGNYSLATTSVAASVGTIAQRALTAGLTGQTTKTYDGNTTAALAANNYSLSGVLAGDTVTLSSPTTGSYADANAGTGKTITADGLALGGSSAGNYSVNTSASAAIGIITQRALTAGLIGQTTKTYDGNSVAALAATNYSLSGVLAGDTVTLSSPSTGAYADRNAGTSKTVTADGLALGGDSAGNYSVNTSVSAAIGTITQRGLTAGLIGQTSKTYDGDTAAGLTASNYSLSGVLAGDTVTLNTPSTGAYADRNAGTGKTVTADGLALGGGSAGNYSVNTSASATIGTINAKVLTAGLTGSTSRVYDGTTTASLTGSNYSLSGVLAGETVTLNTPSTGSYADRNAGTGKTVTASGLTLSGSGAGNYSLASNTTSAAIGIITPRAIAITAEDKQKNGGAADPILTSSITSGSLVQGDSLSGALSRVPGEAAGPYSINQGTLSAGSNYQVAFNGAVFTIRMGTPTMPAFENLAVPLNQASDGTGGLGSLTQSVDSTGGTIGLETAQQIASDDEQSAFEIACPAGEVCPVAPYPSSGFIAASIRFEGYSR